MRAFAYVPKFNSLLSNLLTKTAGQMLTAQSRHLLKWKKSF